MGLDAHVRCTCIQEGKAKAHPFPHRLALDKTNEPVITGNPTLDELLLHDRWFYESCEHGGYILSERLGNIAMIAHVRDLVGNIETNLGLSFPILEGRVIYNGVHSGDYLTCNEAVQLGSEVDAILQSGASLDKPDKEFFTTTKRLCEASISTGNPIVF
jgi:hypothetical protein